MNNQVNLDGRSSQVKNTDKLMRSSRGRKETSLTSFKYLKSENFPIHLLVYWWILWLVLAYTDLNIFIPPSWQTLVQYVFLIFSFLLGHWVVRYRKELCFNAACCLAKPLHYDGLRIGAALLGSVLLCTAILLLSFWLSDALTMSFLEHFARLRATEDEIVLTGSSQLDVLTKIFAFPMSFSVALILLANNIRRYKFTLLLCIANLLIFCYLWQVNYPLIYFFWVLVFVWLLRVRMHGAFDIITPLTVLAVFFALLASATNRYGGDSFGSELSGVIQHYFVGYHLSGFSFYDHQYNDPSSILHSHTFGRSSLGLLDRVLQVTVNFLGGNYEAASLENVAYNSANIDIGLIDTKYTNAFGTFLFGFYRDFDFLGILIGGLAYGAFTTLALHRSGRDWLYGALFLLLASSWMAGMMVNPIEQPYFWFAVIAVSFFSALDRSKRRRIN